MRSRLEARWACWFDLKQDTRWEYEPLDLPGWIPDFVLHIGSANGPALAEVKPVRSLDSWLDTAEAERVRKAIEKSQVFETYECFFLFGIDPRHSWVCLRDGRWHVMPTPPNEAMDSWIVAGNAVQWKAPRQ